MSRFPLAAVAAGAALGLALPELSSRVLRRMLDADVEALRGGDPGPLLGRYAADATLAFPGSNRWSRTYRGRDEIEGFLRSFLEAGLTGEVEDVVIAGPPWRTTMALQFNDEARAPDGSVVYANRAVIFAHVRWGKIVREEVYEDTEKANAFDAYLAEGQPVAPTR